MDDPNEGHDKELSEHVIGLHTRVAGTRRQRGARLGQELVDSARHILLRLGQRGPPPRSHLQRLQRRLEDCRHRARLIGVQLGRRRREAVPDLRLADRGSDRVGAAGVQLLAGVGAERYGEGPPPEEAAERNVARLLRPLVLAP